MGTTSTPNPFEPPKPKKIRKLEADIDPIKNQQLKAEEAERKAQDTARREAFLKGQREDKLRSEDSIRRALERRSELAASRVAFLSSPSVGSVSIQRTPTTSLLSSISLLSNTAPLSSSAVLSGRKGVV